MPEITHVRTFWNDNPCGSTLSDAGERRQYFEEVEQKRYSKEWHIPLVGRFSEFNGKSVLEIGCGLGTDGLQFARNGARYTAVDLTPNGVRLSNERFRVFGVDGSFVNTNAEALPFDDASFDHVYSFGVIHHSPDTEGIVREIHRVLKPGGTFCVMVYNKDSINYYIEIMCFRKLLRWVLLPSFMPKLLASVTGFDRAKLERHRELMTGCRSMTTEQWISINTDGPDCPLAKVYSASDAQRLFSQFREVRTEAWFFDHTHWSFIGDAMPPKLRNWLGRRWGWHRMVYGRKG